MARSHSEYFGAESQQSLQQRAEDLWTLVKDDPRFVTHGRAVGLSDYSDDNLAIQIAIARLLGASSLEGLTPDQASTRKAALQDAGLATDEYEQWSGGPASLDAARDILRQRSLAPDLTLRHVDADTSPEDLQVLDRLTQSCEVLLPRGPILRGRELPSCFLFAQDRAGNIVGAAGAVAQFHKAHPKGGIFWWGMLATDDSRRGEGIALVLGAMAMLRMNEAFGYTDCFTGIRAGNAPSEALCAKLGLSPSDTLVLIAIDPAMLAGGRVTK